VSRAARRIPMRMLGFCRSMCEVHIRSLIGRPMFLHGTTSTTSAPHAVPAAAGVQSSLSARGSRSEQYGIAARKLGRPIKGSAAVDRTREAKIGSLVSRLIKNVFHWTDLDRDSDKQRCLDELAALGIDKEVAVQRCLERLLVELKSAFGIKA